MPPTRPIWSLLALAALVSVGLSATGRADEGGIAVGDGRLHPFLDLQSRYDSFAAINLGGPPGGDLLWDVRPGLKLDVPSPVVSVDGSGDVDFLFYTLNPGYDRVLGDGQLTLGFNRGGTVSFDVGDTFNRSDNSNMVALPFAIISDYNDAGAKLTIRPGGGALSIEPSYDFILEYFEPFGIPAGFSGGCDNPLCNPSLASDMNFYEHKASLTLSWRFLPKTAILLAGDFLYAGYDNPGSGLMANAPLDIVDGTLGIAGLLTSRIELVAKGGYAQTILASSDLSTIPALATVGDAHTFIGQLQLGYIFSETGNIKVGVVRLLQPAPTVLAYYTDTRPYLSAHVLLGGKLTLHFDGSFDFFNYPLDSLGSAAGRQDGYLRLDVGPEYEIARWLRIAAGYDLTSLGSNDQAAFSTFPPNSSSSVFGGPGYANHEGYVRLTLTY